MTVNCTKRFKTHIYTIDKLLNCDNEDELKEIIVPLKGHTIRSYKNFIKELVDNKISVKYKWVASILTSDVVSNRVTVPHLESIYKVLSESSELEKEIKIFTGTVTASSIVNGRWSMQIEDSKTISGSSLSNELLMGVVIGAKYQFTCDEIMCQNNISSKESYNWILNSLVKLE